MNAPRILLTIATVGLLAIAAISFAGPMGGGHGHNGNGYYAMNTNCPNGGGMGGGGMMGRGMMGHGKHMGQGFWNSLTPEQQTAYAALQDEYAKKTEALRTDMWAKHTELQALSGNDKVDPAYITKLVSEMKDLSIKMRAERDAFDAKVEKELGIKNFGRGYGANPNCPYAGTTNTAPDAPAN